MTGNAQPVELTTLLLDRYHEFRERLTRRLGSPDLASDALHETWLKLERRPAGDPIANPVAYLYRAVLNTAANLRKSEGRRLTQAEIADIVDLPDEAPGPHAIVSARGELDQLAIVLAELTERQRAIFEASFLADVSHQALAQRFGVSARTVQIELKRAVEHCAARLRGRKGFAIGAGQVSMDGKGRKR